MVVETYKKGGVKSDAAVRAAAAAPPPTGNTFTTGPSGGLSAALAGVRKKSSSAHRHDGKLLADLRVQHAFPSDSPSPEKSPAPVRASGAAGSGRSVGSCERSDGRKGSLNSAKL